METDVNCSRQQFGPWSILRSDRELEMSAQEISQLTELAQEWSLKGQGNFFTEESNLTYVQKHFNMASVILRFDYVMHSDKPYVYEIEERPALAVGMWANQDVRAGITSLFRELGEYAGRPVKVLVSEGRKDNTDDWLLQDLSERSIFAELHQQAPCQCSDTLYYVRSHRTEEYLWPLADRSISTIRSEGSKAYGVDLGLWKVVRSADELDFGQAFVLKPLAGSRCEEIVFSSPDKNLRGRSTATRVQKFFERNPSGGYMQEMIFPEYCDFLPDGYRVLRRSYLTYSPLRRKWEVLGGVWLGSDNIKIHGTPDVITGAIINPEVALNAGQNKSAPTFIFKFDFYVQTNWYNRMR